MKLTVLFLLVAFLQANAKSYSQITLSLKNASVEKIFNEIERQAGYDFLYTQKMIDHLPLVTIKVKNASVQEVLNKCFEGQALSFLLENKLDNFNEYGGCREYEFRFGQIDMAGSK